MTARYGLNWTLTDEVDKKGNNAGFMADELGHRRHRANVPCFLGGSLHSLRFIGEDVRHCVTRAIFVCVYDGHEVDKKVNPALCRECYAEPRITPDNGGSERSFKIGRECFARLVAELHAIPTGT